MKNSKKNFTSNGKYFEKITFVINFIFQSNNILRFKSYNFDEFC